MADFDAILKKAKGIVGLQGPEDEWKNKIIEVLQNMQSLNEMYATTKDYHYAMIEQINCDRCRKAGFVLRVIHINPPNAVFRFHLDNWKAIDKTTFRCPDCLVKP